MPSMLIFVFIICTTIIVIILRIKALHLWIDDHHISLGLVRLTAQLLSRACPKRVATIRWMFVAVKVGLLLVAIFRLEPCRDSLTA